MKSKRLPGKVLEVVGSRPILGHVYLRASKAFSIDKVVIATSQSWEDRAIIGWSTHQGYVVFQAGKTEDDVLGRFYEVAVLTGAGVIVRLTADNPLIDPAIIDAVVSAQAYHDVDYASNINPPTLPDGLDTEVFTFLALQRAYQEATEAQDREHVTSYMRRSGKFTAVNLLFSPDLSAQRLTVDYPEDMHKMRKIFSELGDECTYLDALKLFVTL